MHILNLTSSEWAGSGLESWNTTQTAESESEPSIISHSWICAWRRGWVPAWKEFGMLPKCLAVHLLSHTPSLERAAGIQSGAVQSREGNDSAFQRWLDSGSECLIPRESSVAVLC